MVAVMRRFVVIAGVVIAGPAPFGTAVAAPPAVAPVVGAVGPYIGVEPLRWEPVAFTGCGSYEIEITDRTAATTTTHEVFPAVGQGSANVGLSTQPPTDLNFGERPYWPRDATNYARLAAGHRYTFRVRAVERAPATGGLYGPVCRGTPPYVINPTPIGPPEAGPWSPATGESLHDGIVPDLAFTLNRGAAATNRVKATVHVARYADPIPTGLPEGASGVAGEVRVRSFADDGVSHLESRFGNVRPGANVPVSLLGADGQKTVAVIAADRAGFTRVEWDRIILDRVAPVVRVRRLAARVPVGAVASFSASATDSVAADGSSGGVAQESFRWRFGDGLPGGITRSASHVFPRAGVFCGAVTVRDAAGNVGRAEFVTHAGVPATRRLGAVRVSRRALPAGAVPRIDVEVCAGRRTPVVVTARRAGGGVRARRVTGGPGSVRVTMPVTAGAWSVVVSAAGERRTAGIRIGTSRRSVGASASAEAGGRGAVPGRGAGGTMLAPWSSASPS